MFCSKCGAKNENGCNFCRKCGHKLDGSQKRDEDCRKDDFTREIGDKTQVKMSPVNVKSKEENNYNDETLVDFSEKDNYREEKKLASGNGKGTLKIIVAMILVGVAAFVGAYLYFSKGDKPKNSKPAQNIVENQDKSNKNEESKKEDSTSDDESDEKKKNLTDNKEDKTVEKDKNKDSEVEDNDKDRESLDSSIDSSSNLYNFNCGNDEYICPALSEEYLNQENFSKLNKHQIQVLINEIFAKHGYKFTEKAWSDYFSSKAWYVGVKSDVKDSELNDFERNNLSVLKNIRKEK